MILPGMSKSELSKIVISELYEKFVQMVYNRQLSDNLSLFNIKLPHTINNNNLTNDDDDDEYEYEDEDEDEDEDEYEDEDDDDEDQDQDQDIVNNNNITHDGGTKKRVQTTKQSYLNKSNKFYKKVHSTRMYHISNRKR